MIRKNLFASLGLILLILSNTVYAKKNTEKAGDLLLGLLPATAYASTFVFNDKQGRKQFYKSFLSNAAVTYALKSTVKKTRPDHSGNDSFPSGHTSVTFQAATFIHKRYGLKLSIPAYLAASYVGWSRVEADKHDTTDVVAGAAIGALSSYYFTTPYKNLSITPISDKNGLGITMNYQW